MLAIARALAKRPKAYLFDEATSALDSRSEEVMKKKAMGHTSISIARRLSTIYHCEKIFVIGEKKIKEHGSFDELLKMKGLFYKMIEETY